VATPEDEVLLCVIFSDWWVEMARFARQFVKHQLSMMIFCSVGWIGVAWAGLPFGVTV
jgi:hypothetical protein